METNVDVVAEFFKCFAVCGEVMKAPQYVYHSCIIAGSWFPEALPGREACSIRTMHHKDT